MHSALVLLVALLSVASAAPAGVNQNDKITREVDHDIIDPWGQYGRKPDGTIRLRDADVIRLLSRQDVGDFKGTIPDCGTTDPSLVQSNTAFAVDQGVKIPKNGDNDECTSGKGGSHCWYEMRPPE
jgi:hypothetical protein